ncbi:MAG: hypothetical protein M3H12_01845, partial [Chromatiales bacterium]
QLEIIELLCGSVARKTTSKKLCHVNLPMELFNCIGLIKRAKRILTICLAQVTCEHLYSKMYFVKLKTPTQLGDGLTLT